ELITLAFDALQPADVDAVDVGPQDGDGQSGAYLAFAVEIGNVEDHADLFGIKVAADIQREARRRRETAAVGFNDQLDVEGAGDTIDDVTVAIDRPREQRTVVEHFVVRIGVWLYAHAFRRSGGG